MSTLLLNTLTGKTSAGSIVVTGEGGSTTTNLQQGLAKATCTFSGAASGATVRDSFNQSSTDDDAVGQYGVNLLVQCHQQNLLRQEVILVIVLQLQGLVVL